MDRIKAASDIIIGIHEVNRGEKEVPVLIQDICSYFDFYKNEQMSEADLKFLRYISNEVGIPHYYGMLNNFQDISNRLDDFDLRTFCSLVSESSLHTSERTMIHKYQKQILSRFSENSLNRFFLSASTSFGKTFLVYEVVKKMGYKNIVFIFPTIALLSENLDKIYNDPTYQWIKDNYSIHTLSDVQEIVSDKNIFIFTPERFLSFIDNQRKINFDFVFVDEVYKIDNDYLIDDETRENERDVAYRLAVFYALLRPKTDALLAGPFIEFSRREDLQYNSSFDEFLRLNNFILLNYNEYEVVNKSIINIKSAQKYVVNDQYSFDFNSINTTERFKTITHVIVNNRENLIVYCSTRNQTEKYAKFLIEDVSFETIDYTDFNSFITHLETVFAKSKEWVVVKALKKGIGIHHGLVPKYIQKEIINLFNSGYLNVLLSTTTITEGVNTSAKNMLVLSDKKGDKFLKKFDAQNIAGRAGRFLQHYKGQVIVLKNDFVKIKEGKEDFIKHKNYDLNSPKEEIDLFHTSDDYLKDEDKKRKQIIDDLQKKMSIPDEILDSYKVIPKKDKISLYEHICKMSNAEITLVEALISKYHVKKNITYDGFETIIRIVLPIVKNENLRRLMTNKKQDRTNSILTDLIYSYLKYGFKGSVNYYSNAKSVDDAIKQTSQFIYNTLKYQVVKYLGAFNLMYKYRKSQIKNKDFEEVAGIEALLFRLEYNSNSRNGRLASDYGVPQKVVEYYDAVSAQESTKISQTFDDFEKSEFEKVKTIIEVQ